ncbi:Aldo/keto reductase [Ramaria rubella]|nr:Aldo/keto reductase [Ramaria rubella]
MDLTIDSRIKLHDGVEMPVLGLGVYEMNDQETRQSVFWALEAGYRLIDSAEWYENERPAGEGVRDFLARNPAVPRADIFFETKLMYNRGKEAVKRALAKSLRDSGLEYIDLYLLHSPIGGKQMRRESWEAVVEAKKAGQIRSVGVSNFGVEHLKEIVEHWPKEHWPSVNQLDLHPFMRRVEIVDYCREHDITLQAWAPLVRSMRFDHPMIVKLAKAHGKTPAQILLRWSLQQGYAPIPKSVRKERIAENTQIFGWELNSEEIEALNGLNEDLLTDWEVTTVDLD